MFSIILNKCLFSPKLVHSSVSTSVLFRSSHSDGGIAYETNKILVKYMSTILLTH